MNPLQWTSIALGTIGLITALWGEFNPRQAQTFFRSLPRDVWLGRILMLINTVWAVYLFQKMNLGGWNVLKQWTLYMSPLIYLFIIRYVDHYLASRAIGLFFILLAKPIVRICFLSDSEYSVILTGIAYLMVVLGMCLVMVPHWLRDLIEFWSGKPARWSWACRFKLVLSIGLVALGIFVYG
jgi:hypothetical protein